MRDHIKAVWIKGSLSSIDIPSLYQAIRKKLLCVWVCICGSMCVVADASLTLPNFKSSVSTLIFSSPALRTLGKTEERDPGSFCHSHPSFVSHRCLVFSFYCSPSLLRHKSLMHTCNHPHPHTFTSSLPKRTTLTTQYTLALERLTVIASSFFLSLTLTQTHTVTLHCQVFGAASWMYQAY